MAAARTFAADTADGLAECAARAVGVEVVELDGLGPIEAASSLFGDVWSQPGERTQMPVNILRAVAHAGSYLAGAYRGDLMVGAIVGFVGTDGSRQKLHSHVCGVRPDARDGVGFALKQHQRAWALARGIDTVTWTFDPLVRRNAYFNMVKLGAVANRYEANFYGSMSDDINADDETDRLVAVWELDSSRARAAAAGRTAPVDLAELGTPDVAVALDLDELEQPVVRGDRGTVVLCRVPADIVALRATDPKLGARWRAALRDTLGAAVADGYHVETLTRSGWYVLRISDL